MLYDIELKDFVMLFGVVIGVEIGCDVVRVFFIIIGNIFLVIIDKVN